MFSFATEDRQLALACALSYWVFRCRDKQRSPAMGLKTWEYFQSSIENSAIPSRNLNDYIVFLSKKLIVPVLKPTEWRRLVKPSQLVMRVSVDADGNMGDLIQTDKDRTLAWESWEQVIKQWTVQYGTTERHVLKQCLTKASIVTVYCRLKHEEDKLQWVNEPEEEAIDV